MERKCGEDTVKDFIKKYGHAWTWSYGIIYLIWWGTLSTASAENFSPVHIRFDDFIPFCEWFIIPYLLWFPYVLFTIAYFFFFAERREYYQLTAFLFIGMTVALMTYTIWPNGVDFRPDPADFGRDNILTRLTSYIYTADRNVNCCPSIHCYNAIGVSIGICRYERKRGKRRLSVAGIVLSGLICLSTVFVKQHSVQDMFWSFGLAVIMYTAVYVLPNRLRKKVSKGIEGVTE